MSEQERQLLSQHSTDIKRVFNLYKNKGNFMAVYFTQLNKPYLTFSIINNFLPTIKIGKNTHILAFVYETSQDFDTQTQTKLSVV
ncbi:MAG TPA: hypothetical protein V6C58_17740 [Allocoleopsis sp.]